MGGTKIVVFHLKEIVKKMIFLCVGLVIIVFLIMMFMPNENRAPETSAALYAPGTYYSEIILHNVPVRVAVSVGENAIIDVTLEDMGETQAVFYPLFETTMDTLAKEIVTTQSLNGTGEIESAYTEEILIKAIRSALDKAENAV